MIDKNIINIYLNKYINVVEIFLKQCFNAHLYLINII